jgi:predicted small metal-binding protein
MMGTAMEKVINCSCGIAIRGTDEEEMVATAQQHAREVHDMDLSREQAQGMIQPA